MINNTRPLAAVMLLTVSLYGPVRAEELFTVPAGV